MGGGRSGGGGGGWGQKYHPNRSLCNNDSDVNDGTATSIKLLSDYSRRRSDPD